MRRAAIALSLLAILLSGCKVKAEERQEAFYRAVLSGNPQEVYSMFHPDLVGEVDEPVLAMWMAAVKENLGEFKGLSWKDWESSSEIDAGGTTAVSGGTVEFEKGTATSRLVFRDGLVTEFSIESEALRGWYRVPDETGIYRERGKDFLERFFAGEAEGAFAMMHANLKQKVPVERLGEMIESVRAESGPSVSVVPRSEKPSVGDEVVLKIYYDVECERIETIASVKFEFVGMKGHILGFNIPDEE
jgi:hypothetical protein